MAALSAHLHLGKFRVRRFGGGAGRGLGESTDEHAQRLVVALGRGSGRRIKGLLARSVGLLRVEAEAQESKGTRLRRKSVMYVLAAGKARIARLALSLTSILKSGIGASEMPTTGW